MDYCVKPSYLTFKKAGKLPRFSITYQDFLVAGITDLGPQDWAVGVDKNSPLPICARAACFDAMQSVSQGSTTSHAICEHASLYLQQRTTAKAALIDMSVGLRKCFGGTVFTTDIDDLDDQTYPGSEQHMRWER
ncbi:hypothetical protein QBC45DRAFT_443184 [Copromyces sp. CBS 386.78]|nr:hypothetical protein QBC45DRAFT_443184 [Copromyces sp. CBS 386.78]